MEFNSRKFGGGLTINVPVTGGTTAPLQIKWGTFQTTGTGQTNTSYSFSSPFSNYCFNVVAVSGSPDRNGGISIGINNITKTGFYASTSTTSGTRTHYYIAIGV